MKKSFKKIHKWFGQNERYVYLEYTFLALLIILPLLKPGYILTLDMVFTPKIRMPIEMGNNYLYGVFLHFSNYLIPSQIIEKILIFLVIFLSGLSMHRLIPTKSIWPKYFAAILYIFNPFVYSRFMAGHINFLLAYAITPFIIKSILNFFKDINFKNTLIISFWLVLISMLSLHSILFIILFIFFSLIFYSVQYRKNIKKIGIMIFSTVSSIIIFILFSLYWIIPFLTKQTATSQLISSFDARHIIGFQTVSDNHFGVLFNTASMYGFWGDRGGRYIVQKEIVPFWYIISLIILLITFWGIYANYKDKSKRIIINILIVIGLISFFLAVGVAYTPFSKITLWLYQKIPLLKGFREPQKFVALLVLIYAYLGALGVDNLIPYLQKKFGILQSHIKKINIKSKKFLYDTSHFIKKSIPTIFLIIPLLYSPAMLWGFGNQLKPVQYPQDWFEANNFLNQDKDNFEVLVFPWHQYIGFIFSKRVIANPAKDYFDKPVIQGDNMEFGQIYSQSNNPPSKYIEQKILSKKDEIKNIGQLLLPLNIKYIILLKEFDQKDYEFLNEQKDLKIVFDSPSLIIYLNKEYNK